MAVGGIDIGGTKIALALADDDGQVLERGRLETKSGAGPLATLVQVTVALEELMRHAGVERLDAVGVGSCGPLDRPSGLIRSPPNLPGWNDVPVVRVLADAFRAPVLLENDCNAAALAELRFGAGQGVSDLLYVTVSTGIGGGVVIGGELHRGLGDGAGELGHQTVDPRGPVCPCGNRGCLEVLASGTALARRAREAIDSGAPGDGDWLIARTRNPATLRAEHVVEGAAAGDPLSRRLWESTLDWLAIGIGNAVSILAPTHVIIGGGVAAAGEAMLFAPLRARLEARVRLVPARELQVLPAACGDEGALLGALALALDARG